MLTIRQVRLLATVALFAAAPLAAGAPEPEADRAEAERLLREVAAGRASLSDEELEAILEALPSEKVDVNLVMLPVVATDRRGRSVPGLEADDFEVIEHGVGERPLAWFSEESSRPFRIALLVDTSGSMSGERTTEQLRDALVPLAREVSLVDKVKLLSFSDADVVERTDWTRRALSVVEQAIELPRGGRTALADALVVAAETLPPVPRERQAIVLVSDGMDNASSASVYEAVAAARSIDVPVYVLGIGGLGREIQDRLEMHSPLDLLETVAEQTGGRFFLVKDHEDALEAAGRIREDLRHQYWLAIHPSSPPDGRFRPLTVRVDRRNVEVRTRLGYR
jgi:VWFA-related protein